MKIRSLRFSDDMKAAEPFKKQNSFIIRFIPVNANSILFVPLYAAGFRDCTATAAPRVYLRCWSPGFTNEVT